jgi:AAA domain-containing protein
METINSTSAAIWMGQMVAREWINRNDITNAFTAAIAHWEDLPKHHKTLDEAIKAGEKDPHPDLADDRVIIRATPYIYVAPNLLKPRGSIYNGYIRKYTSMCVATSKVGKSSKSIVEALAMVTGKPLLGVLPHSLSRVWYWNGEDPLDEIHKRVAAAMKYYKLTEADIDGRLFIDSGRDMPIKIAEIGRNGTVVAFPVIKGVIEALNDTKMDVFIGDPFVSTHRVTENDNNAIQQVAEQWAFIADTTNTALRYNHHTRKTYGEAADFESQRGASSNYAAVRYAEVLNYMTEKEAKDASINPARRKYYFREDSESNLYPPGAENAVWYEKVSVDLENAADGFASDKIGVVVPWDYPQKGSSDITLDQQDRIMVTLKAREGWREDSQAADWIGRPVAEVLGLDLNMKPVRKQVQEIIDKLEQWKLIRPVTIKVNRVDKEGYTAHPVQRTMEV